jgi:hypothetical protein
VRSDYQKLHRPEQFKAVLCRKCGSQTTARRPTAFCDTCVANGVRNARSRYEEKLRKEKERLWRY